MNAPFDLPRAHRWFAVEFNNQAWDAIEAGDFSGDNAERLIDTAHASARHWREAGDALNYLRAQVLLATTYARLGDAPAAVRHAERCLHAASPLGKLGDTLTPWDNACAAGCAALAYTVAGDAEKAASLRAQAESAATQLEDAGDLRLFQRLFGES